MNYVTIPVNIPPPPPDIYNEVYRSLFNSSCIVSTVCQHKLKRVITQGIVHYALFEYSTNEIIIYTKFVVIDDCIYSFPMYSILNTHRSQGWLTYILDIVVLNEGITVQGNGYYDIDIWRCLARNLRYGIFWFHIENPKRLHPFNVNDSNPWDKYQSKLDKQQVYFTTQLLNDEDAEWYNKQQERYRKGSRTIVHYGPGSSGREVWNP